VRECILSAMFSLEIECLPEAREMLIADLWAEGSAGIVELEGGRLRAFFEDAADRQALAERFHAVSSRTEADRDWVAVSRENWEPVLAGERFFLVPEWRDDPTPEGRFRIVVNPGMAFGTGRHETTQLCLEGLETYVHRAMNVLDVGAGTGILAHAARLLGAGRVWACDIDMDAVEIARGYTGGGAFMGTADAVRTGAAGLIVSNISMEAIAGLSGEIWRVLRPGGVALLSGFERHETAGLRAELERLGGVFREARFKGTWAMLVFGRG
jgi:ribosomal protein L11 methyltransferase